MADKKEREKNRRHAGSQTGQPQGTTRPLQVPFFEFEPDQESSGKKYPLLSVQCKRYSEFEQILVEVAAYLNLAQIGRERDIAIGIDNDGGKIHLLLDKGFQQGIHASDLIVESSKEIEGHAILLRVPSGGEFREGATHGQTDEEVSGQRGERNDQDKGRQELGGEGHLLKSLDHDPPSLASL